MKTAERVHGLGCAPTLEGLQPEPRAVWPQRKSRSHSGLARHLGYHGARSHKRRLRRNLPPRPSSTRPPLPTGHPALPSSGSPRENAHMSHPAILPGGGCPASRMLLRTQQPVPDGSVWGGKTCARMERTLSTDPGNVFTTPCSVSLEPPSSAFKCALQHAVMGA